MKLWRLEAVRGVAAVYVVAGHVIKPLPFILQFGQEAVIVFFLLSGFVIEYSSYKSLNKGFIYYFNKRFLRLYSVLICMFLVAIKIQNTDIFNWEFGKQLIGNLLMLQDFETGKPNIIIPPLFSSALWSLHYEWWFYMLYFPVSVYLQRNRQNFTIGIMGVIAVITYLLYPNALNRLIFYFPIWWTGVILARAYINHNKVKWSDVFEPCLYLSMISSILGIQCILHLINAGKLSLGIHPFLEFRHITVAIFIVYLAIGWQNIQWLGFSKIMGWGLRVAPISYALYISHQPFFVSANYLDESINPVIRKALYFTFLILFCWVTEIIIYPYLKNLQRNR